MRYTQYRGLAQVTKWVKLKFAAINLKKLARWKWDDSAHFLFSILFPEYMLKTRLPPNCATGFLDRLRTGFSYD